MVYYRIRSLGTFEVSADGGPPVRLGPKPRALLAQLLVADRPVPVRRISGELWPFGAPESATANMRSYVHLIRRALGAGAIRTLHGGAYQLYLPDARADYRNFLDLLDRSDSADDPQQRMTLSQQALDLWTGPALSGVPHGPMLKCWIARMHGHRRRAVLDLAGTLIDAGRCGSAQDLLWQHLISQPEDEAAYLLLMQALYLAGDVGAALSAYRQAHRELAELGLRPGPRLRAAQHALLNHRPPASTTAPSSTGPGERHTLPPS